MHLILHNILTNLCKSSSRWWWWYDDKSIGSLISDGRNCPLSSDDWRGRLTLFRGVSFHCLVVFVCSAATWWESERSAAVRTVFMQTVWTWWRREISLPLSWIELRPSSPQPVALLHNGYRKGGTLARQTLRKTKNKKSLSYFRGSLIFHTLEHSTPIW
jgi:hypothetical protein